MPTDPQDPTVATVVEVLDALVAQCVAAGPLHVQADPEWPSPCELGEADADGRIAWRPVRREAFDLLDPLAATLERPLHPSLGAYWGRWYSNGFETVCDEGPVSLLGVWNPQDQDQLLNNLLGHALQQRRQRQPLSLFFACTEPDSDLILSVVNDSGEVVLERPGQKERRPVAADLASFLAQLRPAAPAGAAP
ncbi:MAG TPA: SecY-interacting protein Syd [Pseudomonadales bacterium]|nr:SecY-interacting protein Syd [Pseudomonadales bacterium]